MTYWLDLFTGTTWRQFRDAGAAVSGFRESQRSSQNRIQPGDILLCYLTGVMRWVGALEVVGPSTDQRTIWGDGEFPVRFEVKPLVLLEPEHGIPMAELSGRVDFFANREDAGKFKGFVRRSPNRFKDAADAVLILDLMHEAQKRPVSRPVDPKKLARKPLYKVEDRLGKKRIERVVSIPEPESVADNSVNDAAANVEAKSTTTRHTEIQFELAELGAGMGLDVWIARNDRSRIWNGKPLGMLSRVIDEMPTQFNAATQRTIELIDVLWLKGNSIVAAFEVECTTSIYSGLLRMSDLLALQPNLDIKLYLVAPDERAEKVELEIRRPSFDLRPKPLAGACGFLSFSQLMEKVEGIRQLGLSSSLNPDFLEKVAEYFTEEPEE